MPKIPFSAVSMAPAEVISSDFSTQQRSGIYAYIIQLWMAMLPSFSNFKRQNNDDEKKADLSIHPPA
jgi:hypothetical protein